MLHVIQKEILAKLIMNTDQRYSQLKPKHLESNHFMYHLRALMREGWVEKTDEGRYRLTLEGKRFADQVNITTLKIRRQPKIVTLLAIQNANKDWLVHQRAHQPLIHQVGLPYGKLHLGETIQAAAQRELSEKTSLDATLAHRGDGYITICEQGEPVSQISFHLFYGSDPKGELLAKTRYGLNSWVPENTDFTGPAYMASMTDLIRIITQSDINERFFVELSYGQNIDYSIK